MNRDCHLRVIRRIPLMPHYPTLNGPRSLLISFTRLKLDIYFVYITSSCKTLPTWTLSPFFNYLIFVSGFTR
jgi:hypothetical protein